MPFISVVVPTMRAGGIDILLDALAAQDFTDFELVLSDCLHRHRADRVAAAARDRFLRVVHVEPRPNPFPVASFCACANAGLLAATGEVVVFMCDYSRPRPDVLRRHAEHHRADATGRAGLMGPHRYVALDVRPEFPRYASADADRYEDDLRAGRLDRWMMAVGEATGRPAPPWVVDGGQLAQPDADPKLRMPAGPIAHDFFHGKNESVRLERLLVVNGWDEDYDGTHCWQDSDLAARLSFHEGVRWTLDPQAVVEIANPRGCFPMARRVRDFRTNEKVLADKRAAGFPAPNRWNLRERRATLLAGAGAAEDQPPISPPAAPVPASSSGPATRGERKLRVAMIYGEFSTAIHGPFDFAALEDAALTGSEGSFFNLARTLGERGHEVVVIAPAVRAYEHPSGAKMLPIEALRGLPDVHGLDAVVAWNEPDYLKYAPAGVPRIVDQQLNDWGYCRDPQWQDLVDVFVFPSKSSHGNHIPQLRGHDSAIIPNSVDIDLFQRHAVDRHPHRVVYCSSPDRGLHHLLAIWPRVRARVPDAELKIFYRIRPWFDANLLNPSDVGHRARYIEEALRRLADGWGVEVVGPVANREMARQLLMAAVLTYPCDPIRYTEGFGCSVLDACAAGCLPIISDADALAEVHGEAAQVIQGRPNLDVWAQTIVNELTQPEEPNVYRESERAMRAHAEKHSRQRVAKMWENLIREVSKK